MLRKNFFSKYSKCVPIKVNANLLFQNSKPNFFCTKDSDKNYNKAMSNGIQSPGMYKKGSEQEANIGAIEKHRAKFNSKEEKEARMKLLQREITSNPEFFNAFPHLKEKIKLDYMESTNGTQEVEGFLNQNFFIKPSEESQEKKSNYFESLLNKHSGYSRVFKDESEKKLEDDGKFIDGYHTQTGPIKFMTREEKEKVHLEIDKKMRELEDSGLSRQEILFNEPEGIPLKQDKFYQFIKNNKIAREMLVKPTETFSVDLVIEKALKQDIGPDGSLGLKRRNFKLQEDLPLSHELKQYRKTFDPKRPDEMLQSDDFDYRENYVDKLKKQVNFERKKPISFINPPLMRAEARKKFMIKTIQKKDIHWKNLPLLARFLNEGGKMMNKYQTRLPGDIHKKLSRVIKHARHMGLLPNTDFIKPFHKVPFTSMYNEFADDVAKVVDKKTGIIKIIHQPTLQDKYNYSSYDSAVEANKSSLDSLDAEKFKDTLLLDRSEMPFVPNLEQRDLLLAQNHLIKITNHISNSSSKLNSDSLLEEQEKEAFSKVYKEISDKTAHASIIEAYISEKSYDTDHLRENKKSVLKMDTRVEKHKIKEEISNTVQEINNIISKYKIDKVKPVDYLAEAKNFQKYKIEPGMNQKDKKKPQGVSRINYKF